MRSEAEMETYRLHRRFDRMGRLIGDDKMKKLLNSHVIVVGLGGVGSWAAEALARSGVGRLTLVDFDDVCITNSNRQLHAIAGTVGKKKSAIMVERMQKINNQIRVREVPEFYSERNHDAIFADRPDYVIDAIDNVTTKCQLLTRCRADGIPIVCATGSAGRMDPTQIHVKDLSETEVDYLARSVRKILRQKFDFPREGSFGIPAIFSTEPPIDPVDLHYDMGKGFECVCPNTANEFHNCDNRNVIWGSAGFVTGTFGFTAASLAVRSILSRP
ncbi:MAG: tRNA threonylcarbamoyladenosine dehydratase [Bdellovibrionales bacterium]|nr:tRNA threonylcarbamoyladenosine dehydratase [Bdellovibrionales bacterium]